MTLAPTTPIPAPTLEPDDARELADLQQCYTSLQRQHRILLLRSEAAELEMQERHMALLRRLAEKYGFDPHARYTLMADGRLVPEGQGPG